ncbi:hypothetical protein BJ742DRAFT_802234 [Cladochytrium replicatum]|nr:hypothetical protein BJ742DRAFT_802234 [Cladochytrium replicatum]
MDETFDLSRVSDAHRELIFSELDIRGARAPHDFSEPSLPSDLIDGSSLSKLRGGELSLSSGGNRPPNWKAEHNNTAQTSPMFYAQFNISTSDIFNESPPLQENSFAFTEEVSFSNETNQQLYEREDNFQQNDGASPSNSEIHREELERALDGAEINMGSLGDLGGTQMTDCMLEALKQLDDVTMGSLDLDREIEHLGDAERFGTSGASAPQRFFEVDYDNSAESRRLQDRLALEREPNMQTSSPHSSIRALSFSGGERREVPSIHADQSVEASDIQITKMSSTEFKLPLVDETSSITQRKSVGRFNTAVHLSPPPPLSGMSELDVTDAQGSTSLQFSGLVSDARNGLFLLEEMSIANQANERGHEQSIQRPEMPFRRTSSLGLRNSQEATSSGETERQALLERYTRIFGPRDELPTNLINANTAGPRDFSGIGDMPNSRSKERHYEIDFGQGVSNLSSILDITGIEQNFKYVEDSFIPNVEEQNKKSEMMESDLNSLGVYNMASQTPPKLNSRISPTLSLNKNNSHLEIVSSNRIESQMNAEQVSGLSSNSPAHYAESISTSSLSSVRTGDLLRPTYDLTRTTAELTRNEQTGMTNGSNILNQFQRISSTSLASETSQKVDRLIRRDSSGKLIIQSNRGTPLSDTQSMLGGTQTRQSVHQYDIHRNGSHFESTSINMTDVRTAPNVTTSSTGVGDFTTISGATGLDSIGSALDDLLRTSMAQKPKQTDQPKQSAERTPDRMVYGHVGSPNTPMSASALRFSPSMAELLGSGFNTRLMGEDVPRSATSADYKPIGILPEESGSREIISALRILQEKIGLLEGEKSRARKRIEDLEIELLHARQEAFRKSHEHQPLRDEEEERRQQRLHMEAEAEELLRRVQEDEERKRKFEEELRLARQRSVAVGRSCDVIDLGGGFERVDVEVQVEASDTQADGQPELFEESVEHKTAEISDADESFQLRLENDLTNLNARAEILAQRLDQVVAPMSAPSADLAGFSRRSNERLNDEEANSKDCMPPSRTRLADESKDSAAAQTGINAKVELERAKRQIQTLREKLQRMDSDSNVRSDSGRGSNTLWSPQSKAKVVTARLTNPVGSNGFVLDQAEIAKIQREIEMERQSAQATTSLRQRETISRVSATTKIASTVKCVNLNPRSLTSTKPSLLSRVHSSVSDRKKAQTGNGTFGKVANSGSSPKLSKSPKAPPKARGPLRRDSYVEHAMYTNQENDPGIAVAAAAAAAANGALKRDMPFLLGTNTGKSYSLTANLQQVFSMLYSHNPALCSVCRHRGYQQQKAHGSKEHIVSRRPSADIRRGRSKSPLPGKSARDSLRRRSQSQGPPRTSNQSRQSVRSVASDEVNPSSSSARKLSSPSTIKIQHTLGTLSQHFHEIQDADALSPTASMDSLMRALTILEEEFADLKRKYYELVGLYESIAQKTEEGGPINSAVNKKRKKLVGDQLHDVITSLDVKGDQIKILREIIHSSNAQERLSRPSSYSIRNLAQEFNSPTACEGAERGRSRKERSRSRDRKVTSAWSDFNVGGPRGQERKERQPAPIRSEWEFPPEMRPERRRVSKQTAKKAPASLYHRHSSPYRAASSSPQRSRRGSLMRDESKRNHETGKDWSDRNLVGNADHSKGELESPVRDGVLNMRDIDGSASDNDVEYAWIEYGVDWAGKQGGGVKLKGKERGGNTAIHRQRSKSPRGRALESLSLLRNTIKVKEVLAEAMR